MKKHFRLLLGMSLAIYLLTGLYVIRGNEQGVIRRFGQAERELVAPGLHYSFPWPFTRVNKINRNEILTLSIGLGISDETTLTSVEDSPAALRQAEFLTGDKNILLLTAQAQYRIAEPLSFLFSTESPERFLGNLIEAEVCSALSGCGVDYVHPLGLNELRASLTGKVQQAANAHHLGIEIEDVVLADVRPPALVKQAFLDVSNARAERSRLVSEAQTAAEQLQVQSGAASQKIRDEASVERQSRVAIAHAEGARFLNLQQQIPSGDQTHSDTKTAKLRQAALQRIYLQTLSEIIPTLKGRIFTEGDRPIDLTIWENQPKKANTRE